MAEPVRKIRSWLGAAGHHSEEQVARSQLQGHLDEHLLERFLARGVKPNEHAFVIDHLNDCEDCRQAIAVVLLAQDDPSAAAELQLNLKKRVNKKREAWQRRGTRWSIIAILILVILGFVFIMPKTDDPNSRLGQWIASQLRASNESLSWSSSPLFDTSFSDVFSAEVPDDPKPKPVSKAKRHESRGTVVQPGWDSGPAPYVGYVPESSPISQVEMKEPQSASADKAGDKGWFASTTSSDTPPASAAPAAPPPRERRATETQSTANTTPTTTGVAQRPRSRRRLVISADGQLMRTLDGGQTWQTIAIGQNVAFRSLALSGTVVWAAGTRGALFRSIDSADHWQQAILHYRGQPIQADITFIHFNDAQHGEFRTSEGQRWVTGDGGYRWVLIAENQ